MYKFRLKIEERTKKRVLMVAPYVTDGKKLYAVYFADGTDSDYDTDGNEI